MQLVPPAIPSSNIVALGYENPQAIMWIQFKSGKIYEYSNVPLDVYDKIYNGSVFDPKQGRLSVGHTFAVLGRKFPGLYPYKDLTGQVPAFVPGVATTSLIPPAAAIAPAIPAIGQAISTIIETATDRLSDALNQQPSQEEQK